MDSREAARGRVEFVKVRNSHPCPSLPGPPCSCLRPVQASCCPPLRPASMPRPMQVKDWGTGEPTDLGQLQVEANSQVQLSSDAPFYEQLAKRLELLEVRGDG